jgi:predicted ABC-type exoprotein transport system permease subunit
MTESIKNQPDWIEGESIRSYMTTQFQSICVTLIAIPLLFFALQRHADFFELSVWTATSMLLNSYRLWVTKQYNDHLADTDAKSQLLFQRKQTVLLTLVFASWGALVYVFYAKTPLLDQFIGWVCVAIVGIFATIGFAPHLQTLKLVTSSLAIVSIASMAYNDYGLPTKPPHQ